MPGYYPPPPVNIGGAQPFTPRKLAPSITAVQVDQPPFDQRRWFDRITQIWNAPPPLPQLHGPINPTVTNVSVNNPPFGLPNPNLYVIVRAWDISGWPVPLPESPPFTPGVAVTVNNPPFDGRQWFYRLVQIWNAPPAQPTQGRLLNPQLTAVVVNNPPFRRLDPAFNAILAAWNIPAPPTPRQLQPSKSPITASVFTDHVTETGNAADSLGVTTTYANGITEAGSAADTVTSINSGWSQTPPSGGTWTKQNPSGGTWGQTPPSGGTWTKH